MENRLNTLGGHFKTKRRVVFLRHGESEWNLANKFTGWYDSDLTDKGVQEAITAGKTLKSKGFKFDLVFTSVLQRAIKTNHHVLSELDQLWIPHVKSWRLNERHYGALQGLNKKETAVKHGEDQVKIWRRSFDIPPPKLDLNDQRHPSNDDRYKLLPKDSLPCAESLKMTLERVMPYWTDTICPEVIQGKDVLVVAHGNSIRAIIKELTGMSDSEIMGHDVPTGVPLVFEFDSDMKSTNYQYLMDESELKAKMQAVQNQGSISK